MANMKIQSPTSPQKATYTISVVITTKNRSAYLRQAIESVLAAKSTVFKTEIIVVDDGSTDDTPEVLKSYPVRVLRTTGIGMAKARSLGLRTATGDFFTLLDDDDVWMPNNMGPQVALLEKHPEYGAVHAQVLLVRPDLTPYENQWPRERPSSGWIFEDMLVDWPQVGTLLTRREVALEAGDFDPSLTGDNDWDWLLRIAKRHQIGRISDQVLLFRQREEPEESLAWRRFPALLKIFRRHTRSLSIIKRVQLSPILWSHRGWWAGHLLKFAQINYNKGQRKRAYRSLYYAFRCSPPHALRGCLRNWPFKT